MKKLSHINAFVLVILLASCTPVGQAASPVGTEIPQQVELIVADALTQTASAAMATPFPKETPLPIGNSASQRLYKNIDLGIQLSYPESWYLQESVSSSDIFGVVTQIPVISITSFDPAGPPHKLDFTEQTVSAQIRFQPIGTRPVSLENWVQAHRQAARDGQMDIVAEESILISGQPGRYLFLLSGSGGMIHQVLTILNQQEVEINIEGNYALAKAVLDTIQLLAPGGLKPADSDTPAAGICGEPQDDPVSIVLGLGPDGLPKAGRCIVVNPAQRIKLINQSDGPFNIKFAEYMINLPLGNELILDQPVGGYLALGVHILPMGPELWVKPMDAATATVSPPTILRTYSNSEVGYTLTLPANWLIDEN